MAENGSENQAPDLGAFLTNPFGEEYLYTVNRHAFANAASKGVYDAHFSDTLFREDTLYLIAGSDSGLLLRYLLNHDPIPGTRYLVVELPEVLAALDGRLPNLENDPRVVLADTNSWVKAAETMDVEGYLYMGKVKVVRSIAAVDGHYTNYFQLSQYVKDNYEQWEWSVLSGLGQKIFIDAQMANLAENRIPALTMRGRLDGLTCVLLAGGPSLDDILPWVKENRDKLVVMAISRICERLQQEDLAPDIIFVIDPHLACVNASRGIYAFADCSLLIHAYHVYPTVLHQWAGISGFVGNRLPWDCESNPDNFLVTAPTVTNTAITNAILCGAKELILAGVDLCYTADGYTHAEGSAEHEAGPSIAEMTLYVETNDGTRTETNHAYKNGITTIAQQIQEQARPSGCRVINPAPHAARIPGVDYVPLEQIELTEIPTATREAINEPFRSVGREERLLHCQRMLVELFAIRHDVEGVKTLTDDALKSVKRAFGADGSIVNVKQKKELDRIERRLDGKYATASRLIKTYSILEFTRALRPAGKEWTEKEMKGWANAYYEAYRKGAERILTLLDSASHRIELRIEEEFNDPDLLRLSSFWLTEGCPGRIEVLRTRRSLDLAALTERYPIITELEKRFGEQLTNKRMVYAKKAEFTDRQELLKKARDLFSRKDQEGIVRIVKGMSGLEQQNLKELKLLANGYLAELQHDTDGAIEAYHQISDPELIEESLSRLCNLLLGRQDYDTALLALEALTHLSPTYMPQYAELLRLTEKTEQALEEYARYFNFVPNDTRTMFKLARFYRDLGSNEGAQAVLQHILEHEPENQTARALLDELL